MGEAGWGRETALFSAAFELHQCRLSTAFTARKTDINIFGEDMHGENGDMIMSLVSMLYQCFTKTVPLALLDWFLSQKLTVTVRSCQLRQQQLRKCLVKFMLYIEVTLFYGHGRKIMPGPSIYFDNLNGLLACV